jgi:2-phospho-L-lactate guanylyltransferase
VSIRVVIPARPPEEGKTRLAGVLSTGERAALNRALFDHVLAQALRFAPGHCHVISRSAALLAFAERAGAHPIVETGATQNEALAQAAALLAIEGPEPVLSLSSDLPRLSSNDLVAMAEAGAAAAIVAARDVAGLGTNALLMRTPGLIPYLHGTNSLAAHRAAARAAGLEFMEIDRPGLARDMDFPGDLADALDRR